MQDTTRLVGEEHRIPVAAYEVRHGIRLPGTENLVNMRGVEADRVGAEDCQLTPVDPVAYGLLVHAEVPAGLNGAKNSHGWGR